MSADSLAMMPWFARDWLAATRHLALAERGAYLDLLNFQWEMGVLPNDHKRLAMLLGVSVEEFAQVWPAITSKFVNVAGGIANQRLEEHRKTALEQREKKRRAAAATNAKRYGERPAERHAYAASALRGASASPPSPSPSPSLEELHTHNARARDDGHERFEKLKTLYPKFAGRQDWLMAENAATARVQDGRCTWDELEAAVNRYAAYIAGGGASSTIHVLTPVKFFGAHDDPWKQPWDPPTAIPRSAARTTWVPPPDEVAHAS